MQEVVLVFPHHLVEHHPCFDKKKRICFCEDPLFFSDQTYPALFHKQKIVFHRASMKAACARLEKKGYHTLYIEAQELSQGEKDYVKLFKKMEVKALYAMEFDDDILGKRIKSAAEQLKIPLNVEASALFLSPPELFQTVFKGKSHYLFHSFYIAQRKKLRILVDSDLKPLGDKWSFDAENRKKAPKGLKFPKPYIPKPSPFVEEAIEYCENRFSHHPGEVASFHYPTCPLEAKRWLDFFLEEKLYDFGEYEDAMVVQEKVLFHSLLSPLLNSGLLLPGEVVEKTLQHAKEHKIPLNSLEGFLRQVIGWREFIRGVYLQCGVKQRNSNFFRHHKKMPASLYTGTTGIVPVDHVIHSVLKTGYCHHIERLMVLGNFFLLCEIDPNEVYRWFMELFIDAYDWVMVPNVYGMSQYADGGMMTTKPYLSGSNYLLKMSDFPKGEWTAIWDALFWRFMIKHQGFFEKQPRMQMLCEMAKKKKEDKQLMKKAEDFLVELHS